MTDEPESQRTFLGLPSTRAQSLAIRGHLRGVLLQHLVIILLGLGFFTLDAREFDPATNRVLICLAVLGKAGFFVVSQAKRVLAMTMRDFGYHHFLLLLGMNILLVVISFAVDYGCLHTVDPASFRGLALHDGPLIVAFQCFALSLLMFSNIGPIGVEPITVAAQFVVMIEALLSFVTLIVFFSDFASLRDSIRDEARNADRDPRDPRDRDG